MNENLYLRRADEHDKDLLFEWANDNSVRENSFETHIITPEEHEKWFERLLKDEEQVQFILMKDKKPIGQIRLSIEGANAIIGYSLSRSERGSGFGKDMIRLLIEKVKYEYPDIKKLIGRVKPSNPESVQCLNKNGFNEVYRQFELTVRGLE